MPTAMQLEKGNGKAAPADDAAQTGLTPVSQPPKRTNPLPGEQIPLEQEEKGRLFNELYTLWNEAEWPEEDRLQREADWKEYNCTEKPLPRVFPIQTFDGEGHSANMKFPLLRRYVDAWVAQVSDSVFSERPLISVEPSFGETDPDRSERVEQRFDMVYESVLHYPRIADRWIRRTAIEGTGILYIPYRKRDKYLLKRYDPAKGEQPLTRAKVYDGPKPQVIPLDRFRLFPRNSETIESAWAIFYQFPIRLQELRDGRKETVDEAKVVAPAKYVITDEEWNRLKQGSVTDTVAEEDEDTSSVLTEVDAVLCYFRYGYMKGRPDLPVKCIFLPKFNLVISITPSDTGDVRPFVQMKCRETGTGFVGMPMNRIIDQCVEAINTSWNEMDNTARLRHLLSVSPFFTPALDFDLNKPWLGKPVPVADAAGVRYIEIGADMDALPRIRFLLEMLEGSIGVTANDLGIQIPTTRTATEIDTMATKAARLFREQIELMNVSHQEVAEIVAWQYYLNGPDKEFYLARPTKKDLQLLGYTDNPSNGLAQAAGAPANGLPQGTTPSPGGIGGGSNGPLSPTGGAAGPMGNGAAGPGIGPPPTTDPLIAAQQGLPTAAPPAPQGPPPAFVAREVWAEDFAPGLVYLVRGSGAHMNRAQELQQALESRTQFVGDPLIMEDTQRLWALDRAVLVAGRHPDPEAVIGPKPEPGTSVPELMAKATPQPPAAAAEGPSGPSISIAIAMKDLPPDAQAALLQEIGLPGDMAAQGYRDQLEMEKAKQDSEVKLQEAQMSAEIDLEKMNRETQMKSQQMSAEIGMKHEQMATDTAMKNAQMDRQGKMDEQRMKTETKLAEDKSKRDIALTREKAKARPRPAAAGSRPKPKK